MRRQFLVAAIAIIISAGPPFGSAPAIPAPVSAEEGDAILRRAFKNRTSNVQVAGEGVVSKTMSDDQEDSRHQRFILRLRSGQTLLITHNIDLAPRIPALAERDVVGFYGEYEWNSKGGVIHWTHRDPARKHQDGWLKHKGKIYQ